MAADPRDLLRRVLVAWEEAEQGLAPPRDLVADVAAYVADEEGEEVIAIFPLPAEWETVERMLNSVWQDGPQWSGANTVAGARWVLEVREGSLVVVDRPRSDG